MQTIESPFLKRVRDTMRAQHLSLRTERAYLPYRSRCLHAATPRTTAGPQHAMHLLHPRSESEAHISLRVCL